MRSKSGLVVLLLSAFFSCAYGSKHLRDTADVTGSGVFVYDVNFDLQPSPTVPGALVSQWASQFSNDAIRYIYPDFGWVNPDLSFSYGILPKTGQAFPGKAITAAYHQWKTADTHSLRVMPIVEFSSDTPFEDVSASLDQITALADTIADTINSDPNADGVLFDMEHTPASGQPAYNWYAFFQEVQARLKTGPGAQTPAKLVANFASKGFFTRVANAQGQTMWQLFSQGDAGNNSFVIISQYDLGLDADNGVLEDLKTYTCGLNSSNINPVAGTIGTAVQNKVAFQLGIPASASVNNWASANFYGSMAKTGITMAPDINEASCPSGALPCTAVAQELSVSNETIPIQQVDYVCAALTTFSNIMMQSPPSICTPKIPLNACPNPNPAGYIPGVENYMMGVALYRLMDNTQEIQACNTYAGNSFCEATAASETITSGDPSMVLFNSWINNVFNKMG